MSQSVDVDTQQNILNAQTLRGRPPHSRLVPYRNVRHLLDNRAMESPDKVFLIHYDKDGNRDELTYAAFNARVNQTANLLLALGVQRGDRVSTIAYNHTDTVITYFACWKIGAMVAPQNVAEDDQRIAYILRNSEAVIALVRSEYLERAEQIIHGTEEGLGVSNIRQIIQVGGEPDAAYPHYQSLLERHSTSLDANDDTTLDDESLLVYTSGTTGPPKGVVLTQYNMLVDAYGISSWQGITGNQRMMAVLPIHHVNGTIVTLVTPMLVGASTVLNRAYSSSHFWERIAKEKVNVVSVVPTLLQFSCEFADEQALKGESIFGTDLDREDLSHFRHLICGAGTLAVQLARRFENQFGFPILHGYGLSETTCYSCFLPIDLSWEQHQHWMQDYGYPSIGCPISPNEMAIFDPTGSGQELPAGERGEICIRGHNVMKYYYQRPDSNRETFKFSWFRSGDEGFYQEDAQGRRFFFITGRIKELINRGGVKFSPFDIEEVLLEIPGIKVGLAVAFENDYYGEEVGAYVVLEDNATLNAEAILDYCRERMTFEKSPKVVIFGDEIPVTTTGKYQRLKLRDRFSAWKTTQFRK
ncbi:MAG: acyl--CoA ligase [Anaerolineales bacterium]|nr:acyl--CoA ligase [Anaerolineales bacterium]